MSFKERQPCLLYRALLIQALVNLFKIPNSITLVNPKINRHLVTNQPGRFTKKNIVYFKFVDTCESSYSRLKYFLSLWLFSQFIVIFSIYGNGAMYISTCSCEISTGSRNMIQVTLSSRGGVVSEPGYVQQAEISSVTGERDQSERWIEEQVSELDIQGLSLTDYKHV